MDVIVGASGVPGAPGEGTCDPRGLPWPPEGARPDHTADMVVQTRGINCSLVVASRDSCLASPLVAGGSRDPNAVILLVQPMSPGVLLFGLICH